MLVEGRQAGRAEGSRAAHPLVTSKPLINQREQKSKGDVGDGSHHDDEPG